MSSIDIHAVRKAFKGTEVLKTVSLHIRDQEFCVLLGPSGCGKTTLLRIVAGLETQNAGTVTLGARAVDGLPPRARNIAMVFQNYAVFPHMSVRENIAFGLRMKRAPAAHVRQQVDRAAELMHIGHLLDRYSAQLSGGQRQRVAVARALAVEPDVLLMDEPLSNLDALLRLEMRTELKALLRELRTTTLYVTHDQVEAMSLGDRIAVMHAGEIVQIDTPPAVYTHPATRFVGGFIGNPPMNFIGDTRFFAALGTKPPADARWLGIRPEDLDIVPSAGEGVAVKALVVEMLGASLQIAARLGDDLVRISTPADLVVEAGQSLTVRAKADKARWYDAHNRLITTP